MKILLTGTTGKDLVSLVIELKNSKLTFDVANHLQYDPDTSACNTFIANHAVLIAAQKEIESEASVLEGTLAIAKAEADGKVRASWDPADGKMTEEGVKSKVRSNPRVQTVEDAVKDARAAASFVTAFLSASSIKYAQVVAYLYNNSTTKQKP